MLLFLILWPLATAILSAIIGLTGLTGLTGDLTSDSTKSISRRNGRFSDLLLLSCAVELIAVLWSAYRCVSGETLRFDADTICGLGVHFTLDGFRAIWGMLASFCWTMSSALAREYLEAHSGRYAVFTLLTLCGTMGVFLSADLCTTFLFFELMSLASWAWVAHEDEPKAQYAADTYLAVAVTGGLVTLMGLFILYYLTGGNLTIDGLYERCQPLFRSDPVLLVTAGILTLLGFGAKAGMYPLHFWLPMAHPVAPAPASALLSGVLTKCGLFGILVMSCGVFYGNLRWGEIVLGLGTVTMLWGAVLGVFSVDLKRVLACSSVSQIGFILVGVGISCILGEENALATRGLLLHMVNHSLIKLVLFLLAGVIAMNRHTLELNRLRGCCRGNQPLLFAFLTAGLSVAGIPLFSGYVSKTLLHESIVEWTALVKAVGGSWVLRGIEWVFLLSGGLTLAYMSKLFYTLFVLPPDKKPDKLDKKSDKNPEPLHMRPLSTAAVVLPACLLLVMGLFPYATMDRIAGLGQAFLHGAPLAEPVAYFSLENLSGAAISISIGVLVFFGFIRRRLMGKDKKGVPMHRDVWPQWFDLERRILRPVVGTALPAVCGAVFRLLDYLPDTILLLLRKTLLRSRRPVPQAVANSELLDHLGHALDRLGRRMGREEEKPSFVYLLAEKEHAFTLTTRLIVASLSFGLLLFCVGLILTLFYLLV